MAEIIQIHTARLRLRQWQEADKEAFAALNADPRVMEFFPELLARPASDAMADRISALISERGWGFWALEEARTASFIGFAGLHQCDADMPVVPRLEIGWRLAFDYWGKGYASEAARGALQLAFERLGFDSLVSFTAVRNWRSQAVMARIGMHHRGERFFHPRLAREHPLCEHLLYRLTRAQWAGEAKLLP